uniref:Uncharacterized protein n=1 Tax=viral metagenome TaxID=1070528 RepID=A0A6C0KHW0_9ZZZZ
MITNNIHIHIIFIYSNYLDNDLMLNRKIDSTQKQNKNYTYSITHILQQ